MPPRLPGQPTRVMERYRERLAQEMKTQGLTDRTLAEKMKEAGFPIPHSAVFKTRSGNRQPSLDEVSAVARILGYPNFESFIEGPHTVRINSAVARLQNSVTLDAMRVRNEVHDALLQLSWALEDEAATSAADALNTNWRAEYEKGLEHDLRWAWRDQMALWNETLNRLHEIFHGVPKPSETEMRALTEDIVRKGVAERDPSIVELVEQVAAERRHGDSKDPV